MLQKVMDDPGGQILDWGHLWLEKWEPGSTLLARTVKGSLPMPSIFSASLLSFTLWSRCAQTLQSSECAATC